MPDVRLIDANALKDAFCAMIFPRSRVDVLRTIDDAPTIEAQPVKRGKWERTDMFVKCSACGVELLEEEFFSICIFDSGYMPFCPNCGYKMTD